MRIDRSRFLLLASAIAAGCGPREGAPRTPTTATDADAGAPRVSTTAPPKHAMSPPHVEGSAYEGAGLDVDPSYAEGMPPPHAEGWMPPPHAEGWPGAEGSLSMPSLSAMGVPLSSWTCNGSDDVGKPAYCAVKVPKSCAPFPFVGQACRGARKYFKPKIAERAVSCMHKLTPDGVCGAMTYECREAALKSACPDSTADNDCQVLAKSCPKMSMAECRTYMNGLNVAGRAEVFKCMSQPSGCGFGVYSCVEGLND